VAGTVRVGTSGWSYRHWRGSVYPPDLSPRAWLRHYATLFDTVEVNATFYRLPRRETVASWAEETPLGFLFAVKGSRYLTHVKRLRDPGGGIERLFAVLEPLEQAGKLGPLLWQLPESFRRRDERLAAFLDALPPGRHAVELRHPSWFCADVYALLRERGAALVIADHPQRPYQARELTASWTYLRFHHGDRADSDYSDAALAAWASWIDSCRAQADVYAYFNNDWAIGLSPESAQRYVGFAARVGRRTIGL
jgi:uncharacterized protein YecE (DUF72 family)